MRLTDTLGAILEQVRLSAHRANAVVQRHAQRELREILLSPSYSHPDRLEHFGFRVFSKHGQDGIIQEIFRRIGVTNKRFVEFGAETGIECNTRLLHWTGWTGLWIEANPKSVGKLRQLFAPALREKTIAVEEAFVEVANINQLLQRAGVTGEIDLLSVDIDGNDIHVMKAITVIKPRVVCIEYNASMPPSVDFCVPYDRAFAWDGTIYFGASLLHVTKAMEVKGYTLVGSDICGSDAFYVRKDLVKDHFWNAGNVSRLFNPARYRLNVGFPTGHKTPPSEPDFNPDGEDRPAAVTRAKTA